MILEEITEQPVQLPLPAFSDLVAVALISLLLVAWLLP